jgi:predicted enzyme related to lactoylglutathione lyase
MFYGVTHVDLPVSELERSQRLYVDVMGLSVKRAGEGWVELESGTVGLRLMQTKRPERLTALRVQVPDVDAALNTLVAAGAKLLYATMRTPELELVAQVADFDGHIITVWRELSEDEYGFAPELPKEMTWAPEAEELMKSLLKHVPALFRALARRKVVREAEALAKSTNLVTKDAVVRGYILASARVTRSRAIEPLRAHGYDPDDYRAEFEAE